MTDHIILPTKKRVEIFTLEMRADGILHLHADGDHIIDIRMYKAVIAAVGEITHGKKVPILSTTEELTLPDEEVRAYMMRPDANPFSRANALIVPSLAQKILGNLFIKMMQTTRPMKMFRTEEEAITWLKAFVYKS